jgi:ribose transport system permease protein
MAATNSNPVNLPAKSDRPAGFQEMWRRYGVLSIFVVLIAVSYLLSPVFLSPQNIMNLLRQSSINVSISMGMLLVIISGGIDLSVGPMTALSGIILAMSIGAGMPAWLAVLIALACALPLGSINGSFIAYGRIAPFIMTLASMTVVRGATYMVTHSRPIFISNPLISFMGEGAILGIPVPVVVMLTVTFITQFLLKRTVWGRGLYAVGGNSEAARLAGINVERKLVSAYVISSLFAFIAGVIMASRLSIGSPRVGVGFELDAIASVVIGGASMSGGTGSATNTLLGALLVAYIANILNLLGVQTYVQQVVTGVIILTAVLARRK